MITNSCDLNMTPTRWTNVIHVSQYDDIGRTITFRLYSEPGTWSAPSSATAMLNGTKPDGKAFSYAGTYSSGRVTFTIKKQMTAVPGRVRCKVKLTSGSETIESAPIILVVDSAGVSDNAIISTSDINDAVEIAVEKVIQRLKTTIPSDYTELSKQVASNTDDIDSLKTQVSKLDTTTLSNKISKNEKDIGALQTGVSSNAEKIKDISDTITDVKALVGVIPNTSTSTTITDYISESKISALKDSSDYTDKQITTAITDANLSQYATVKALSDAITRINTLEEELEKLKNNTTGENPEETELKDE